MYVYACMSVYACICVCNKLGNSVGFGQVRSKNIKYIPNPKVLMGLTVDPYSTHSILRLGLVLVGY